MKKYLFILVCLCVSSVWANVVINESFNREVGRLTSGSMQEDMGEDTNNWWYTTSTTTHIEVVDTNLTYNGYQTEVAGKAVRFKGNTNKAARQFNSIVSQAGKSVYYSLLLNVHTPKNSDSKDYIVTLLEGGDFATATKNFAQLRIVSNGGRTGYKLGISKSSESWVRWYPQEFERNKTYLIVVRYDFVVGDKNDVVSLWINPTKMSEGSPSLVCAQDSLSGSTNMSAGGKNDAASLDCFYLRPSTNTPALATIDEVRVATKWTELFESSSSETDPQIGGLPASLDYGIVFAGEKAEKTINLTAQNLTEDITITHTNSEISLSASTVAKEVAMASGLPLTVTLNPAKAGAFTDDIVVSSSGVTEHVAVSWTTYAPTDCASVADLKKAANEASVADKDTLLRFAGTATVTRIAGDELYIQDNTGAIRIDNTLHTWPTSISVGDNITAFRATNGGFALGIQSLVPQSAPTIKSSGNSVTPQVVTLAALQASPLDYLLEVVTVENVAIDNTAGTFSVGDFTISQNSKTATIKVEAASGLAGVSIPEKANVTGFSFNQTGSIIVPRSSADIVNKSSKLLQNAGFEDFTTSSDKGLTTAAYTYWSFSGGAWATTTEATDVVEGSNAFKTSSEFKINGTLYQSVDVTNFNTGDEFEFRINYKTLDPKGDNAVSLASYWASVKDGELPDDAAKLKTPLDNTSEWKQVAVRTKKPANATKFEFTLTVTANSIVLFDDFAFSYIEPDTYFSVTPETVTSVQTNINEEISVATFTIRQKGLTNPVTLTITGQNPEMFKLDKSSVSAPEETVKVSYAPTATGHHSAALNVMNDEVSSCNRLISLSGVAIDPTKTPTITISPTSLPPFACAAKEEVSKTITVNSENCTDFVYATVNNTQGSAFLIDGSMIPKNIEATTVITFKPMEAGEYAATITWTTEGGQSVTLNVTGTATAAPEVIDYATDFVWDSSNPLDLMDEGFNNAADYRNKTLKVVGWQNVVTKGDRAWWGYTTDTSTVAKATGYYFNVSQEHDAEMWLVTPALNFKTPNVKQFGFEILGEIIFEGQQGGVELYYIDATANPVHMEHIAAVDSLIPANDAELANQWTPVVADLTGQPIADVFFIAFRFFDKAGTNGVTYQLDNVTWGKQVLAIDNANDQRPASTQKIIRDGHLYILRNGNIYTVHGQRIE